MIALVTLLLSLAPHVVSQTTNATCTSNSTTSWLFNADGESPCLVWSKLQSLCLSSTSYLNVPPLLSSHYGYNVPSSPGTLCQCNAVAYGLMAGCSWCQVGNSSSWVSEKQYRASCSEYNNTSLSFAETVVTLPGYAFATWNGSKWDAAQASASPTVTVEPTVASTTLSRSFPQSSGTPTASPSSPSTTSSSGASPSDNASSSSSDAVTRWGPVVGGIAGGMIAILALGLLWRWYRRRRAPNAGVFGATTGVREKGSFLDMITDRPSSKDGRRDTEYFADPETFAAPRPAPKPSGLRYTTTSQRLQERQDSADSISFYNGSGEDEPLPPPRALVGHGESEAARHSFGPILSPSTHSFMDENGSPKAPPQAYLASHASPQSQTQTGPLARALSIPHTHSIDFSAAASPTGRAPSFTDTRTLPSLYEPRTGAERYSHVSEEPISPESRYPMTERPGSDATIGAALGSGRMVEWNRANRDSVPDVPKRNSRQSYP